MSRQYVEDYCWDAHQKLGDGTYGTVFKGSHVKQGYEVAVKEIPLEKFKLAEYQLLKNLSHENIVKLYDSFEKERFKYLFFEFCSGSLDKLLKEPKYMYGLDEDLFLTLLDHMTKVLLFLNQRKIVHRDIKPGNILISKQANGDIVFKLADFGSAKILEDNDYFMSVHGTPSFMYPALLAQLKKIDPEQNEVGLDSQVDLWSLAATLYQAACNKIAFRVPGDSKAQNFINQLLERPSDVIAGHYENDKIKWRRKLPTYCSLNKGLRTRIDTILRSVFEVCKQEAWTMSSFLNHMDHFYRFTKLCVCFLPSMRTSKVYVKSGTSGKDLVEVIRKEFGIENETVELYKGQSLSLSSIENDVTNMDFFTKNSADNPLVFIDISQFASPNLSLNDQMKIPKTLRFPVVQPSNSPEVDAKAIEKFAAAVWMMRRRVDDISSVNQILGSALTSLGSYMRDSLSNFQAESSYLLLSYGQNVQESQYQRVQQMRQQLEFYARMTNYDKENSTNMKKQLKEFYDFCMKMKSPNENDPSILNKVTHRRNNLKELHRNGYTLMENFRKYFIQNSRKHYQHCTNLFTQVQLEWLKLEEHKNELQTGPRPTG